MSRAAVQLFLNHIPLYVQTAAPYIAIGAFALSVVALVLVISLKARLTRLALGRNGSIEETLAVLTRDTKELHIFRAELEKYLKLAELRLRSSVQGLGVVRFNPYSGDGSGGNQSFALAFLDERLSGVVFSTLYSRDRIGVYAKPVENGVSTFELSGEEKEAIEKAKKSIVVNKQRKAAQ